MSLSERIPKSRRLARLWTLTCLACLLLAAARGRLCAGQRNQDNDDDFDDAGFDDSGYNSPQNHDTESSNQQPSNYSPSSEEDLDDDDDVDETHVAPTHQAAPPLNQLGEPLEPQRFYSPPNSVLLANVQPAGGRYKRSLAKEADPEDLSESRVLVRRKRHSKKYIGPVYTYVKTDKHAHYKWGVKHKVGKHHGRR